MNDDLEVRLAEVRQHITEAAQKSGRTAEQVMLVAVTKTHPPETVSEILRLGVPHIGENKVQEARAKKESAGERGFWHLLGHLQSNKAKYAAQIFDWVESVDSWEIAADLNRHATAASRRLTILLEVNVSGEAAKFGLKPEAVAAVAEKVNALPALELRGLMTLAPYFTEVEKTRPVFARLREIRDRVEQETGLILPELSMGMSNDFSIAVQEGSTMVRLGTALFGTRPGPAP